MNVIGCDRFSRSRNRLLIIPIEAEALPRKRCYSISADVAHSLESAATEAIPFAPYFLSLLRGRKNPIHPATPDRNKSIPRTSSPLSSRSYDITNRRVKLNLYHLPRFIPEEIQWSKIVDVKRYPVSSPHGYKSIQGIQ